jgi:hypothetical protein
VCAGRSELAIAVINQIRGRDMNDFSAFSIRAKRAGRHGRHLLAAPKLGEGRSLLAKLLKAWIIAQRVPKRIKLKIGNG